MQDNINTDNQIEKNIHKICEGLIVKNYKELCELLEIPVQSGKSKKIQLQDLMRYVEYKKEGHKFIITKIYKNPNKKKDKRKETIYGQYIEKLILDLLVHHEKNNRKNTILLTPKILFKYLRLVNDNYSYCYNNKHELSAYLNIDAGYIKDFYNNTYSKLISVIESALKRLTGKMLIHWQKSIVIVYRKNLTEEKHTIANDDMTNYIIAMEKIVAESMGYNTKKDILLHGNIKLFNKKVIAKINEENKSILYYYRAYKINFNNYVKKEQTKIGLLLENSLKELYQQNLNKQIITNYKQSAVKRNSKYKNKYLIGKSRLKHEQIIASDNFVENTYELIDTLININTENLIPEIAEAYKEQKKYEDLEYDEVLELLDNIM